VTDRSVGQRVVATFMSGSHAELFSIPSVVTWPVPDGADIIPVACVPVAWGTADDCLFEFGRLQSGETVLVQAGAGGVGLAAIQLAKRAGATVLATASSDDRLERLRTFGLDEPVNYSHADWVDRVRTITGGRGVDLVVDSVGGRVLAGSLQCLAYRGRAISVGNAGREAQPLDISSLAMGNRSLTGVFLGAEIATERVRAMIARQIDDVAAGRLQVVVDRVYPLAEAAAAHAYIESRQAFGRVVLRP
jgi:NADPH2:quinone reductase